MSVDQKCIVAGHLCERRKERAGVAPGDYSPPATRSGPAANQVSRCSLRVEDISWPAEEIVVGGRGLVALDLRAHGVKTPPNL